MASHPLRFSQDAHSSAHESIQAKRVGAAHDWTVDMRELLRQLSEKLCQTNESWDRFCQKDMVLYFRDVAQPACRYLPSIYASFDHLK